MTGAFARLPQEARTTSFVGSTRAAGTGSWPSITERRLAGADEPGQFRLHSLEKGKLTHVTLDVADYDGDGDLDLLASSFAGFTFATADTGYKADSWVELLENKATHPAAPAPTK